MPNSYFSFKRFTVFHDKCAMKVGTDGVLLGAWAGIEHAGTVLDVGTGSGLIALMTAQRNASAKITAIDTDRNAVEQAEENVCRSPFSDRITVRNGSFQEFAKDAAGTFEAIVSNPPYFTDSLLPPDKHRSNARHSVSLTLEELLAGCRICLTFNGKLSLILPFDKREDLWRLSGKYDFFVVKETSVHSLPDVPPKRLLAELTLQRRHEQIQDMLVIEKAHHTYTDAFVGLVKDFYLNV